jgi:cell division septal protein FtsQ
MLQHINQRQRRASPDLDDAVARRAQIRAIAAGLVDGPRMGRRFHVPAGVPLQPSGRLRTHGPRQRPAAAGARRGPVARRIAAGAFLVIQVGILVALLASPAFKVHTVAVTGDRLLSRDAVLAAARVPLSSLFTVDGDAIRARIAALQWVRSATVTTQLPSTVRIAVTEWQPDVLLRHASDSTFVAANGATLPFTQSTAAARKGVPLVLDYRPGAQRPLMTGLAELLATAAQRWPSTYGCIVDAYVISSSNVFSAWCSSGWQAVFGSLDSSEAVAAIPGQLAVLAALKGHVDMVKPAFGYIDLESPNSPAIGGKPGEPASLHADIAATVLPTTAPPQIDPGPATPTAAASPTAPAAPTPRPIPTPLVFSIAPPSPSPHR